MNKFLTWMKGFMKINYNVELAEEPNLSIINLDVMDSIFESITKTLSFYSCSSLIFSINEFKATKLSTKSFLYNNLKEKKRPICHLKVSRCGLEFSYKREILISSTVFCLGIDNNIWQFDFKLRCICNTLNPDIDSELVNLLIEYLNAYIRCIKLNVMCQHEIFIENTSEYDSMHTEYFTGWVKSYCNDKEYQNYASVDDLATMENEATILLSESDDPYIQNKVEEESMIVDVIRRKDSSKLRKGVDISDIFDHDTNHNASINTLISNPKYDHKLYIPKNEVKEK